MKCIILEYPDGSISTRGGLGSTQLAKWIDPTKAPYNQKDALALIARTSPQKVADARDSALNWIMETLVPRQNPGTIAHIADVQFPDEKDQFRPAWRKKGNKIEADMEVSRGLHMNEIRKARNGELAKLDVEYSKADEAGNQARKQEVALKRQMLRDIPQTFDLTKAKDTKALKRLWPKDLPQGVSPMTKFVFPF